MKLRKELGIGTDLGVEEKYCPQSGPVKGWKLVRILDCIWVLFRVALVKVGIAQGVVCLH